MPRRVRALATVLLAASSLQLVAAAEPGPLSPPAHSERRGLTAIVSSGRLPAGQDAAGLVARLRRDGRTACETPVAARDGALEVELLLRGRLLAGRYALEVVRGEEVLLQAPLVVGSEAEQAAVLTRHRAWLHGAAGALRDLAAALERRGVYHLRRGELDPQRNVSRLSAFLNDSWYPALRTAWLDLTTFQRRVVLAPEPEALEQLLAVHARLGERARAWDDAVTALRSGRVEPPPPDPALRAAAERLLATAWPADDADARAERLRDWEAGPLGEPPADWDPALAQGGTWHDQALGWRLELPAGFQGQPTVRPDERLLLDGTGGRAVVTVSELPDARDAAALTAAVEALAWESFTSYKRLEGRPLTSAGTAGPVGLRLEFTAEFAGSPTHVVQRTLFAPTATGAGRVINLLVSWPLAAAPPAWLDALEAGFARETP